MPKIVHITTVHASTDVRIFDKECKSLASVGYDVTLLAAGASPRQEDGVSVRPLPHHQSRVRRITQGSFQAFRAAVSEQADLYHFHDPELMLIGWLLRLSGRKVIYDVHEDTPRDIHSKPYLPRWIRGPVSLVVEGVEQISARALSGIVAATPAIAGRFPAARTVVVRNYPRLGHFRAVSARPYHQRAAEVIYVGGLSVDRGCAEMAASALKWSTDVAATLVIAGKFDSSALEHAAPRLPGWRLVSYLGWLTHEEVIERLGAARVGLVVLHPTDSYRNALPVKLFEYMAAGLPVVASDFPLWRSIVQDSRCGILVDPKDPQAIADAVSSLLKDPDLASVLGENGRRSAERDYSWEKESKTLIRFCNRILQGNSRADGA